MFIFACFLMIMVLAFHPSVIYAQLAWPFGFQIKEVVTCECSGFNHRYKPLRWGLPAPLPPIWMQKGERYAGGSLATTPFHVPIPFFPQDEFIHQSVNKQEWVMGITHGIPLLVPCVNLVFTWTGPKCKREWGWLWRIIGSAKDPDRTTPRW